MDRRAILGLTMISTLLLSAQPPRAEQDLPPRAPEIVLQPTKHPRVPTDVSLLWLAPTSHARTPEMTALASAIAAELDSNFAKALPLLAPAGIRQGTLGEYAAYYQGVAELRLTRPADARRTFQALRSTQPTGYLAEAAALREGESDEALGDNQAALEVYEKLASTKTSSPEDVLMRVGHAARVTGYLEKATDAFMRVIYEFPFSDYVPQALAELDSLPAPPIAPGSNRYKLELGRGERLFGAKKWAQARPVFEGVRGAAQDDADRELIALRLAECDYYLKRARNARDGVKPYIEKASRQGEALFFYAIAVRDLGETDEYVRTIRRLVQNFSDQSWAEEGLNNLATYYILQDDDAQADATFREMYEKFPTGRYAERGAWKVGWYAFRNARYADAARAFESGAAHFPRSDYRPAWLYWSGRAHQALSEGAVAETRYSLVVTDYLNTYYGRLAAKRLEGRAVPLLVRDVQRPDAPDPEASPSATSPSIPPNAPVIRALLALDLYDQALDELHYAQRVWGDSPAIQATLGYIFNRRGDLRAGINAMKRAYPQYMTAGGERLPIDLLKILFPVDYWPQIRRYATERQLDPYVIAALVLQESNFTANIRSAANAYGLMQIVPATGRQYARTLKLPKRFSISMLTTADTNLNMGTAYFSDLVRRFGGVHYALATYNAGPSRVARWMAEKPGIPQDEFIDDIPFPETQNYVKRILGQAEDYRRLYSESGGAVAEARSAPARPAVARTTSPAPVKTAARKAAPAASTKKPAAKKPAAKAPAKPAAKKRATARAKKTA